MEKQVTFEIPARKVQGEIIDVYENGSAKFRYLLHFDDEVRIFRDEIVPIEKLTLE